MEDFPLSVDATPEESGKDGYNIEFLKSKGYFTESTELEDEFDSGEEIQYVFDADNRIAYFEGVPIGNVSKIVKRLRRKRNFDYYWFWEPDEGRLEVLRTFGENKRFIYNPEVHVRDTRTSKENKLSKLDEEELSLLFDVKDVVNRFYRDLWSHRLDLAKSIELPEDDLSDQSRILAAQRIIDRMIFTYFLAEKGIVIGIAPNGVIGEINAKKLFRKLVTDSEDFGELLKTIFYNRFNSKSKNDYSLGESDFSVYLPYLNGGLFRPQDLETESGELVSEENLIINGFNWEDLIEELNQYNWILEDFEVETTTEGKVRGELTPEILGYIYEKFVITVSELGDGEITLESMEIKQDSKLQSGNKEIGAYYTPEDVVNYIVNENLWSYLQEEVPEASDFNDFDEFYEEYKSEEDILEKVNESLSELKIVDPGVGSGHFLISTANKLEDWRTKCGNDVDLYDLRKEVVLNNLYGVDIMEGATEICQLRFWLWLVSAQDITDVLDEASNLRELEEKVDIEPLPNIDYNIRTGNSLIGFASKKLQVDGHSILPAHGLEEDIKTYQEKVNEIKDKHSDIEDLRAEIEAVHQSTEEALNKKYAEYLNAHANSEGVQRQMHFEDGEDFLQKTQNLSDEVYIKIQSKKEIEEELNSLFSSDNKKTAKGVLEREKFARFAELIDDHGPENWKTSLIETKYRESDFDDYNSLHWILEFPEVFEGNSNGFDIVVGNPPYGSDVLSANEKEFLRTYSTRGCGDICGYFLEREIDLTRTGGFLGNVIAGALAVNNSMTPVRDYMRDNGSFELSFIGKRPDQIFHGVEIRVSTVNGQITRERSPIKTSKNIRFTSETRSKIFDDLNFESTEGLLLGSKIGVRKRGEDTRLPKIGDSESREILEKLRDKSKDRILGDMIEEGGDRQLQLRKSAFYWVNALKNFPYNNTMIRTVKFEDETERDFSLALLNSSLFYFYWMVYGNNRHVFINMVEKFPVPQREAIGKYANDINSLATRVDKCISETFDPDAGANGEFSTGKCKPLLDEADDLLGKLYGLEKSEIEFIKNYNSDIRLSDRVLKKSET
ncbi:MAG: Eco57I restriction-modification methylase domain-containing protein [Candidatus Nanosalina sp.]